MFACPHRLLPLLGGDIPEDLGPILDGLSPEEIRLALAIGLYAEKTFGLQTCAQLAGLDRASFLQHMVARKISVGHVLHEIAA